MSVKITIGGDFCITESYLSENLFSSELEKLFLNSDINIVNLECPVIEDSNTNKILKTGPHLFSYKDIFKHLKKLDIQLLTLANNHILDYGTIGLENTIKNCEANNIKYVGVGKNLKDASKPIIIEKKGIRIAFVNFCENEWSIANDKSGGANPMDIIDNLTQIKSARKIADFVFVIIHGGHEYYNLPSPRMVKQYRFFAENGADAIIGHHTHCISGHEIYQNVPIFYSLGNMLFTRPKKVESWYTGLILQVEIERKKPIKWEIHPIEHSDEDFNLILLNGYHKRKVLKEFGEYSKIIGNKKDLLKNWKLFIQSKKEDLNIFSPINILPGRYLKGALKRLGLNNILLRKNYLANLLNQMRCEALKDVTIELIDKKISK